MLPLCFRYLLMLICCLFDAFLLSLLMLPPPFSFERLAYCAFAAADLLPAAYAIAIWSPFSFAADIF